MISLLVGMHFRPPAKLVLEALRGGTSLRLIPEPSNPYDAFAIQVWVATSSIPESQQESLREKLPEMGWTLDGLFELETIQLGYVAASGGKPLAASGLAAGSGEFAEALHETNGVARLGFLPTGTPTVELVSP